MGLNFFSIQISLHTTWEAQNDVFRLEVKGYSPYRAQKRSIGILSLFYSFFFSFWGCCSLSPQRFDPLPAQRVPFVLFWDIHFFDGPYNFSIKCPEFDGETRAGKLQFWTVFSKFCLLCRKFGQNRVFFSVSGELGKSIWSTYKKIDKIF